MFKNENTKETIYTIVLISSFFIIAAILNWLIVSTPVTQTDDAEETTWEVERFEPDAGVAIDASLAEPEQSSITHEDIILGAMTTEFQSYGRLYSNRARNIRRATRILNGTIVQPGVTFSFNETVGPRDREHGFREAPTIIGGEMTESYGGGVCQIASTLFSAAVYSGLTIVETRPHSHYMHYIDPGFDSTVFYGFVDLRFRNDFDFPVTILAETNDSNELNIRILGREQIYLVTVDVRTLFRRGITEQRTLNEDLDPGTQRITDFGTSRERVRRTITYTPVVLSEHYQAREDVRMINYAPTPRLVEFH
jgi:vancomycin resistance protein YoaR